MKKLSIALVLGFVLMAAPAEATRYSWSQISKDRCGNIGGVQTSVELVGITAKYQFIQREDGTYYKRRCELRPRW